MFGLVLMTASSQILADALLATTSDTLLRNVRVRTLTYLLVAYLGSGLPLCGRAADPVSGFEVCMAHVNTIQELSRKFENHRVAGAGLRKDQREALGSLAETRGTIQSLLNEQMNESLNLLQNQMNLAMTQSQMEEEWKKKEEFDLKYDVDVRHTIGFQFRYLSNQVPISKNAVGLSEQVADLGFHIDASIHKLKTLDVAGNLAVQRQISLMQEIKRRFLEMQGWDRKSVQLFDRYWEVADILAMQSDLETKVGARALKKSASDNPGAGFLRAVILIRQKEYSEALPIIDALARLPAIRARVLTLKAEWFARQGMEKEARQLLQNVLAIGKNDVRVRLHRGQVFAILGELDRAEQEWRLVLKYGDYDIAAHRAIALINASRTKLSSAQKLKSLEEAEVAAQLAADDWSCVATLAIAAAVNDNQKLAVENAKKASNLTVGSKRLLCEEMLAKFEADQPFAWEF